MITLKTLVQASEQEVFDQAVNHMLSQMQKSQSPYGDCVYKNEEGLKCAAGCFISDEEYSKYEMEGNGWDTLVEKGKVPREHMALIKRMQHVHDSEIPEYWETRLRHIAKDQDLKFNYINK